MDKVLSHDANFKNVYFNKFSKYYILEEKNTMKEKNQKIKCNVESCKYNNEKDCLCNLDSIDVTCTCNKCECKNKVETICNSFKEK